MTTTLHAPDAPEDLARNYGPNYDRYGIVVDHLHLAEAAGFRVHTAANGLRTFVYAERGGRGIPVLCGEIVATMTEDGPSDGRCGLHAVRSAEGEVYACAGHTAERQAWAAQTEIERSAWERHLENAR